MDETIVCGVLGKHPQAKKIMVHWNHWGAMQATSFVCIRYSATVDTLPERLSEMFVFDRYLYCIGPEFAEPVQSLVDISLSDNPNIIINSNGVLFAISVSVDFILKPNEIIDYCTEQVRNYYRKI